MGRGPRKYTTNDQNAPVAPVWFHFNVGTLTSTQTWKFAAPFDGLFNDADHTIIAWDASPSPNAKTVTGNVLIGATSIFSTTPRVSGTAGTDRSTLLAGTGIRQAVLKTARADVSFDKGDQITVSLTESVAAGDPTFTSISVGLTPFQDIDPDSTVERE